MRFCRLLIIFLYMSNSYAIQSIGQELDFSDRIFSEFVKTVRLFPLMNVPGTELLPPAAPIDRDFTLMLEFDDLYAEYERYYVKFIHCNADWSPSGLFPLDFLDSYNEFAIEDYDFSFNTRVPYIHYRFELPPLKLPGNYLLIVYKDSEENVILSKRLVIYDNKMILKNELGSVGMGALSRMTQEIQFSLNYTYGNFYDPQSNFQATIKQNQRWDNAIYNLKPTRVREDIKEMEFKHFNLENQFLGGNQFRFFDLLSLEYFGRNVDEVDLQKEIPLATLEIDKPRKGRAYGEYPDYNGKYRVSHPLESDYAYIEFFLETEMIDGHVYVAGELTNWERAKDYQMTYLNARNGYYITILLKQGYYDYQYLVEGSNLPLNYIEGDHFETENEYEILVYYNSFELNTDLLVGYFVLSRNPKY